MANDKGLLRIDEVQDFRNYLTLNSVGHANGHGQYEVVRVFCEGTTQVVTRNSKDVISTPPALRYLLDKFRAQHNVFDDTRRLDFLLTSNYRIGTTCHGTNGRGVFFYESYIENGLFGDKVGNSLHEEGPDDYVLDLAKKRQLIDSVLANQ